MKVSPRFFLVFLVAVSVVMLPGCASTMIRQYVGMNDIPKVKSFIADGNDIDSQPPGLYTTVLMDAIRLGHIEMIKVLITSGANVNAEDTVLLDTPLDYSFTYLPKEKQSEIVSMLINKGANVNHANKYRKATPIHRAALNLHTDPRAVKLLIKSGAMIDPRDNEGESPLIWAAMFDNTEVAKLLIANGAEVNLANNTGTTALMKAYYKGSVNMVKLLLSKGADSSIRDSSGRVASDYLDLAQRDKENVARAQEQERQDKRVHQTFPWVT